jgi:predicted RNA-binding protein with PUA-like domain
MHYLLKTEPSEYSFADLQRDKMTIWDGVTNPVALKNLRAMKPGDHLIIYHTGDERRTVGTASVTSVDLADQKKPVVKIKAGRELPRPMSLAEIKANRAFQDSPLLKQGRLSVVPLTEPQYRVIAGG